MSNEPRSRPHTHRGRSATTGRDLPHVAALDGLRAAAVIAVVAFHFGAGFSPRADGSGLVRNGFLGVDLFFVLSGFLITSLLLGERQRTGAVDLGGFYRRRAYRLLPALFVVLAVTVLIAAAGAGGSVRVVLATAAQGVFYVANLATSLGWERAPDLNHLWSLSVEEQFYIVWPLALLALTRLRRSTVTVVLVVLIVASALLRLRWTGDGNLAVVHRTEVRADALLIGALAACAHRWGWVRRSARTPLLMAGAAAFTILVFVDRDLLWFARGGYTLVAVAAAAAVLGAADPGPTVDRLLSWSPAVTVGKVSYAIYLWHVPMSFLVERNAGGWPAFVQMLAATALTAAGTWASWRWIEQPALAWSRRTRTVVGPAAV